MRVGKSDFSARFSEEMRRYERPTLTLMESVKQQVRDIMMDEIHYMLKQLLKAKP